MDQKKLLIACRLLVSGAKQADIHESIMETMIDHAHGRIGGFHGRLGWRRAGNDPHHFTLFFTFNTKDDIVGLITKLSRISGLTILASTVKDNPPR